MNVLESGKNRLLSALKFFVLILKFDHWMTRVRPNTNTTTHTETEEERTTECVWDQSQSIKLQLNTKIYSNIIGS